MSKKFIKQIVKSIDIHLSETDEKVIIKHDNFDVNKNNVSYKKLNPLITFNLKNGKTISHVFSLVFLTKITNKRLKSIKDTFLTCDCGVPECAGIFNQLLRKTKERFHLYLERQVLNETSKYSYEKIILSFPQEMLYKAIEEFFHKVEECFSDVKNFSYIEDLIKSDLIKSNKIPELPHLNFYLVDKLYLLESNVQYFAKCCKVTWNQAKNIIMANEYFIFKNFYKHSKLGILYK